MPNFIQTLAEQTGGQMMGGIMGLALGGINDRRQYNQQERLQALQMQGQKQMTDYQFQKQLEMWKATNYSAQVEQMKQAGINPGLLYGMSGGGATTTGGGGANVQGASAPTGGREVQDIMGLQMQRELLKAQKENIEADTANKKADIPIKEVQKPNIEADTKNKAAQEIMTNVQTRIARLDERLKGETLDEQIEMVAWQTGIALEELDRKTRENVTLKATQNDTIDTIKAEMFGAWIRNAMMKQEITESGQRIKKSEKEIWKIQAEVENIIRQGLQGWDKLSVEQRNATTTENKQRHDQWVNDLQQSTGLPTDLIERALQAIILKNVMTQPGTTPVRGFRP